MKQFLTRLLVPVAYWLSRFQKKPRQPSVSLPPQLLPLLDLGTLAVGYSNFTGRAVESFQLSNVIQSVIDGTHTPETQQWIAKILFGGRFFDDAYDWMVALGDAQEARRELFRTYYFVDKKSSTPRA